MHAIYLFIYLFCTLWILVGSAGRLKMNTDIIYIFFFVKSKRLFNVGYADDISVQMITFVFGYI